MKFTIHENIKFRVLQEGDFGGDNKSLFDWKHPRVQILKGKSLKKKDIEENEMGLSLKLVYSHPCFLFSSF